MKEEIDRLDHINIFKLYIPKTSKPLPVWCHPFSGVPGKDRKRFIVISPCHGRTHYWRKKRELVPGETPGRKEACITGWNRDSQGRTPRAAVKRTMGSRSWAMDPSPLPWARVRRPCWVRFCPSWALELMAVCLKGMKRSPPSGVLGPS